MQRQVTTGGKQVFIIIKDPIEADLKEVMLTTQIISTTSKETTTVRNNFLTIILLHYYIP